jgi:hypothetical protein
MPKSSRGMVRKRSLYRQWRIGGDAFSKGERICLTFPGPENPWHMILVKKLAACQQKLFDLCKNPCHHLLIGKRHACGSFKTGLVWWNSILAGFRMLYRSTKRAKECQIRSSFWRDEWISSQLTLNGLWLVTSRGSSCVISLTLSERRRVVVLLIESNKTLRQKDAWFRSIGQPMESTVFLIFQNGQHAMHFSSLMLSSPVWLRFLSQGVAWRRWMDVWSTWITHVPTIRSDLRSVPGLPKPKGWRVRPTARTVLRATPSSLDLSKNKYLTVIVRDNQTS